MGWACRTSYLYTILCGKPGGRDRMGDTCLDGSIILKMVLKKVF
jgi:hypothetical protein